jgi:hypothetical protein
MFIIMYPLGVAGELLTIYTALPYVRKTGMLSMRLPNKYNVSFDYYYFLVIVMLSYIPCKQPTYNVSVCSADRWASVTHGSSLSLVLTSRIVQ